MSELSMRLCGDDLVSIDTVDAETAQQLARVLGADEAWLEVVPGLTGVVVQFDPARMGAADAEARLRTVQLPEGHTSADAGPEIVLPVHYGGDAGPDLDAVCESLGMTRDAFIRAHSAGCYRVQMLGFTPGFAYVGGLDPRLEVGRLATPRQRVAAGSVGVAGACTGLYALPGPGGWPIIGRTPAALFDADRDEPFLLRAGQRVRFQPVGEGST